MEKSGKKKKNEQDPHFHYRVRSFRIADETYEALKEAFKSSGKRSWNLLFVEAIKSLNKK